MSVWLFDNNEFRIEAFIIVRLFSCLRRSLNLANQAFFFNLDTSSSNLAIYPRSLASPISPIVDFVLLALSLFDSQGFDEFMNLVLDDAEEVYIEKSGKETKARQDLGK